MKYRPLVVSAHRWLSLSVLALWLVQAATGVFAVFHWEIDDAMVDGTQRPTNFRAIERNLLALTPPGVSVGSIWTTAGAPDRWDVNLSDRVVRVDGEGRPLRVRLDSERWADGGFVATFVEIHHDLLAGDRGRMLIGASGLLLLANAILGLIAAWPRAGQWAKALRPPAGGSTKALLYSWHRAFGLWISIPLLFIAGAGVMLAFESRVEGWLDAGWELPKESGTPLIGMADAVETALRHFPDAAVSGIGFPSSDLAIWKITLKREREMRRAYGKSRVFVSALDGRIVATHDATRAATGRHIFDSLFAFHAGEMFGVGGRFVSVLTGSLLVALIVLGLSLFVVRR